MRVYEVQLVGFCGPCIWDSLDGALEEIKSLIGEEADPNIGTEISIKLSEMSKEKLEAMGEFQGY